MDVQVFGAGSLGTLLGAILDDKGHTVHLVGRAGHVEAIRRNGVNVVGEMEFTATPSADTEPRDADVSFVTVKSYDTKEAAQRLEGLQDTVVSLQNGMGNEETLREHLSCRVLAGATTYGARKTGAGEVEYTGQGEIYVGAADGGRSEEAEQLADMLSPALEIEASQRMPVVLWRKLAVNTAVNPVTALTGLSNGEAVEEAEDVVRAAAKETAEVAQACGVDLDPSGCSDHAVEVACNTGDNRSSMLEDIDNGRRTEVDAVNGYVVELADARGFEAPVNSTLHGLVSAIEPDEV